MRTSCPWSTMRILTPQPQLGRLLRFLYANGALNLELQVRFERTGTFVSRLQGACNRPLCDWSIFNNRIRKYTNSLTDLRRTYLVIQEYY